VLGPIADFKLNVGGLLGALICMVAYSETGSGPVHFHNNRIFSTRATAVSCRVLRPPCSNAVDLNSAPFKDDLVNAPLLVNHAPAVPD